VVTTGTRPRRLSRRPVLDGLRGIAILLVMLMHTGLLAGGYIGVDVFFALSGFLITTLLCEEWERTGSISFRGFYERRARRLLPGLLLLVGGFALLYVTLHPFTGWPLGARALTTLLFVNNWVVGLGHTAVLGALNPTWSLAEEDQFYLVWPLLLWLLLRRRTSAPAMLGILALAIVSLVAMVPTIEHLDPRYDLYYSPLGRGAELLVGCAAAIAWRHRLVPAPVRWRVTGWLLAAALGGLLLLRNVPSDWIYLGAVAVAAPLLVNLLANPRTALARAVGCAPLRATGRISYGLYLFNLVIHNLLSHYLPGRSTWLYAACVFPLTFLVAGASWRFVEAPALNGRRPYSRGRTRPVRRARLEPAR
jgi:peptidoglycan/LPS O-acetylase OafA/YrhL